MSLRKLLVAGVAAMLPAGAFASEPGRTAPFSWSGVYVGASVGGAAAGTRFGSGTSLGFDDGGIGYRSFGSLSLGSDLRPSAFGAIGGLNIGFNQQFGRVVLGAVGDFSVLSLRGRDSAGGTFDAQAEDCFDGSCGSWGATGYATTSFVSRLTALATLRARVGYSFDRGLVYVTGGLAYGRVSNRLQTFSQIDAADDGDTGFNFAGPAGATLRGDFSSSGWRPGYVVGAGAEYALASSWSLGVEALYYNLGSSSLRGTPTVTDFYGATAEGEVVSARARTSGMIARIGLNYRF